MPLRFKRFERIRSHFAFRFTKLGVVVLAVTLAVAIVATLTVDLGPGLRGLAEREGSKRVGRPMHIGRLGVRLFNGKFVLEDFVIEGLVPTDRPFLTAKRIDVSLTWDALLPPRSARRFGRDDRLAHGARAVGRRQAQLSEIQHGRQQQQPPALRHDDAVRADEERHGHVRRSRIAMGHVRAQPRHHRHQVRRLSRRGELPRRHGLDSGLRADEHVDEGHLPRRRRGRPFREHEAASPTAPSRTSPATPTSRTGRR